MEFGWPDVITKEMANASANLHKKVSEVEWVQDPVVAYGGVGTGLPCIWIFSLTSYGDLDKLLHPIKSKDNELAVAYQNFFTKMVNVETKIKHEVQFLEMN